MQINPVSLWSRCSNWFMQPIAWVWVGGLILRIYSAGMRTIINPDGSQYIYQASTILNQDWANLLTCKLNWLSPFPPAIAAVFIVCRDWVVAAQIVNVLFGWMTLFPIYYILRRYFNDKVSTITVLIYALMPVLVDGSSNVIRGPMFWFSAAMGMLFFVRQWDENRQGDLFRRDLLASMIFFLLSALCRIEGVVFLAAPVVYLLIAQTDRKFQRCAFFLMPIIAMGVLFAAIVMVSGTDILNTFRLTQIKQEATQFIANVHHLDEWLEETRNQIGDSTAAEFLHRAREALLLIPPVLIFQNVLEGVFYPFALIFLMGIMGIRFQYRQNRRTAFFAWQTLAGLMILYIHMLQTWIITPRFLAILILPGCFIMACGVDKAAHLLGKWRSMPAEKAFGWLVAILIVLGLPKSLKPEESDKLIYREAAELVERRGAESVSIAGYERTRALEWLIVYSHRDSGVVPCSSGLDGIITPDYRQFVKNLDQAGIRYLLYEERFWPKGIIDLPSAPYQNDFRVLGHWLRSDSKMFMLLERF